jgi:hypothetical protein
MMDEKVLAEAFNAWMDDYANHPERFAKDEEQTQRHLEERAGGKPLTYGDRAVATLFRYMAWQRDFGIAKRAIKQGERVGITIHADGRMESDAITFPSS